MDINRAFEILNGLAVNPDEVTDGPFYTGGPMSPIGLDLPERTFYIQNISGGVIIWRKFGTGVNDWRQLSAQDIPFDPSSVDLISTNGQAAIEELANRNYGKDASSKTKEVDEFTTGTVFSEYDSLVFTVNDNSGSNKYRIAANFFYGHNSASNDIRARLTLDGSPVYEIRVEPKDSGIDQRLPAHIVDYPVNLTNGNHTIGLEYRPSSGNRVSRMYRSTLEVWRVS